MLEILNPVLTPAHRQTQSVTPVCLNRRARIFAIYDYHGLFISVGSKNFIGDDIVVLANKRLAVPKYRLPTTYISDDPSVWRNKFIVRIDVILTPAIAMMWRILTNVVGIIESNRLLAKHRYLAR